jgi:hypothetical protein
MDGLKFNASLLRLACFTDSGFGNSLIQVDIGAVRRNSYFVYQILMD